MKVILSGGGTGGHIYPAIAVANELRENVPGIDILFVGAQGRMEMEKVPAAGYPIRGLWISGLERKISLRNGMFPLKVVSSLTASVLLLRRFRPDVVVGFGGYASGPVLRAASWLHVPMLIQEQNSYAGITNKILAKYADRICVAYPGMEAVFPKDKIVLTGNPVRSDLLESKSKRAEAHAYFGLKDNKKTILLFGGSLGARTLNRMMGDQTEFFRQHEEIQVLWQMGKLYAEGYAGSATASLAHVHAMPFIDRMDLAYAAADVVISRAGALTISELALAGKAAILVPSPNVAEDHQTKNAKALVQRNAAELVPDKQAADALQMALDILNTEERKMQLEVSIAALAKPHAAKEIAQLVIAAAKG